MKLLFISLPLLIAVVYLIPFGHYFYARQLGLKFSLPRLIGMRIRKVDTKTILNAWLEAKPLTPKITIDNLEALSLAGGKPLEVIRRMVLAQSEK